MFFQCVVISTARSHRCPKKMLKYCEVSKILAVRSVDGHKEYGVRWKGYEIKDDTWVTEQDCNSVMTNYARSSLNGEYIAIERN